MNQEEHFLSCPYCNAPISVLLDPSTSQQEYVEDCEVCCNPIDFQVKFVGGELVMLEAKRQDEW